MADFSNIINKKISRLMRRKLYGIICEHVKNFEDENALAHVKNFMEGVSWATGLRCAVRGDGVVYVYLRDSDLVRKSVLLIDVYVEIKILRNSINRHYYKQDKKNLKEVCFDVRK